MYEITFLYTPFRPYCCRDMSALDEAAFTPYKEQIGANAKRKWCSEQRWPNIVCEFHTCKYYIINNYAFRVSRTMRVV